MGRLEQEEPETFKIIQQVDGFRHTTNEFEYKVGKSQYGLWLSRKRLGLDLQQTDTVMVQMMSQLIDALKLVAWSNVASDENDRNEIRKKVLAQ